MSAFQIQSSEVLARLKPFGIAFEKSLSDLIKGIRAHSKESPESLALFLDSAIEECKTELNTTDLEVKAMAILKLAYLEMYGFEMSWCNFHILEIMASTRFQQKRVGYLAAMQSFKNEQDLLILATNQFKKDLNSHNHIEIGLALSGIATIVTPNLSKDINDDVLMKLSHSKPYIRKKAILAMYKIFLQYPDSLRINFDRVIEKLDDEDISVVSATINVICEISKKNPKIFISYIPKFFALLEDTRNNWLIIRILKLFQSLSKVEPRMKKKFLPTLVDLMTKTQASSLIYECINCIVNGGMLSSDSYKDKEIAKLCVEQLMNFFRNGDANLKFVGLLALINIIKIYPELMQSVNGLSGIIMDCIVDEDLIIKRKALEVCHYLIDEANFVQLIKVLLLQLIPNNDSLRLEVTKKILTIGASDNYSNIPNFKWYIIVLKDMINLTLLPAGSASAASKVSSSISNSISTLIGEEFKTLATRIPAIRPNVMEVIAEFIMDVRVLENCPLLLKDFFWIFGEYIDDLRVSSENDEEVDDEENDDDFEVEHSPTLTLRKKEEIFNKLVNFRIDKALEASNENANFDLSTKLIQLKTDIVLIVLIQALIKIFSSIVADYNSNYGINGRLSRTYYVQLAYTLDKLIAFLSNWEYHGNYEVQEISLSWLEFLKLCLEAMIGDDNSEINVKLDEEIAFYKALTKTRIEESDSESQVEGSSSDEDDEGEEESDDDDVNAEADNGYDRAPSDAFMEGNNRDDNLCYTSLPDTAPDSSSLQSLPGLLTNILPAFFKSYSLNPIAKNGQKNIELPFDLDIETQIHSPPSFLISDLEGPESADDTVYSESDDEVQNTGSQEQLGVLQTRKQERLERLNDDPYYIVADEDLKKKKKKKDLEKMLNKKALSSETGSETTSLVDISTKKKSKKLKKEKVVILSEETFSGKAVPVALNDNSEVVRPKRKKNLLKIDSSNLDNFDLNSSSVSEIASGSNDKFDYEVDLNELRKQLAQSSLERKTKDEKKKKKKKKVDKVSQKSPELLAVDSPGEHTGVGSIGLKQAADVVGTNGTKDTDGSNTPESAIIAVKKPKKSKKKTKAIIQD